VEAKVSHCKAIAKSTGKPCKRAPVKNGLCRYHLPRDERRDDPLPDKEAEARKNPALGEAFRDQNHTTRQKNRFIRVIVVSTRRKKKKK
tara:strand:+ start:740 stop:1006 length:267 start_codon:yes stop_codon:yes gene_type:complete